MFSMITKLALSSESGWGTAFRVNGGVEVCQQSLFWLVCKGMPCDMRDITLSDFIGSVVVVCQFSLQKLVEFLDFNEIPYFLEDDRVRWLLPSNISSIYYIQWKKHTIELNKSEFYGGCILN
ncbi:hypothetical protein Q4Q57_11570 [Shewanella sp. SP2S2-6]|uniref:hypothetical protein n=1 Tax=Shewanella sp. SP2S2-6 TaxID=3063540 RepID=UPI00288DAE2E|nr:hypothetical protein [Shewanella sp. SP2S2-6]MDT3295784.1 hypothetical protein [Shewanella sp. SP2S2-6]